MSKYQFLMVGSIIETGKECGMHIDTPEWKQFVVKGAAAFGISVDADRINLLARHAMELVRWNRKTNLTAITDPTEIAVKHVIDCIAAVPAIGHCGPMLDIGSGGGYPGIVLKIMCPLLPVTLIDASRKKVNFLKHIIRALHLKGIQAHHLRAEAMADDSNFARAFRVIVCRAVCSIGDFTAMALPLLREDGRLVAMKGRTREAETEMAALRNLKYTVTDKSGLKEWGVSASLESYKLNWLNSQRSLVIIRPDRCKRVPPSDDTGYE